MTVGVVCNFFREMAALPSFFGPAEAMFDELVFVHASPNGERDDPSIETVFKSGHKLIFDTVADGFGALRTRCIGYSKCDWVVIMDADERMWAEAPIITPKGTDQWPQNKNPQNSVVGGASKYDQRHLLRKMIERADADDCLALCLSRRHFMGAPGDFSQPCQNWQINADWQLRCVKNDPFVCYDPQVRMHERLIDTRTWSDPKFMRGDQELGPFFDHFSQHFKALEPEQNAEDAKTYETLEAGCVEKMWLGHQPGVSVN